MRSYLPLMSITPPASPGLYPKFGGLPWGLPPNRWPLCRCCDEPMSALAQIPVRGNLDRIGWIAARADMADRVLHLFTCEGPSDCPFWELENGANAAFFLREGELGHAVSVPPSAPEGNGTSRAGGGSGTAAIPPSPEATPVLPEVWIVGWDPYDDAIPPDAADAFFDERYWELPDEPTSPDDAGVTLRTKIGEVPHWTGNGPQRVPGRPFRYALQIDIWLSVIEHDRGVDLGNFCSDGTGYVYIDVAGPEPRALFAINR